MWTFLCYIAADGNDAIGHWRAAQTGVVQGAIDAVIEGLANTSRGRWRRAAFEDLGLKGQDECKGLSEVKIVAEGAHYRIFGFFGPGSLEFSLLFAFKKDCDPDYSKSCIAAQSRRTDVEYDASRLQRCRFP